MTSALLLSQAITRLWTEKIWQKTTHTEEQTTGRGPAVPCSRRPYLLALLTWQTPSQSDLGQKVLVGSRWTSTKSFNNANSLDMPAMKFSTSAVNNCKEIYTTVVVFEFFYHRQIPVNVLAKVVLNLHCTFCWRQTNNNGHKHKWISLFNCFQTCTVQVWDI